MSPHHDDRDGICPVTGSRPKSAPAVPDFVAARSLKRQLLAELRASWEEGQPIPPEDLLNRWPANAQDDPDVASLLCEDYWQRRQQGQQPTAEEYSCRFPGQKESLAGLLEHQALLRSCGGKGTPASRLMGLPGVGDELFGFRLCHELGSGSFARVFLAEQKTLAGRPVVVKVSAIDGDEPQTLAQLQHTHIVPIYSVHEDPTAGLRVVCMPYFGGATLARVLEVLGTEKSLPAHGKQLVAALTTVRNPLSAADEAAQTADRGPLALLARLPYVDAAAWVIARLAEALQHAYQRGILHHDVKPSNILLCADGQPMLLDFNLAENCRDDRAMTAGNVGGTVAYMAPEHLLALATRDPAFVAQVDHRADLYGLGIVFYELLAGRNPFEQNRSGSPLPTRIEAMAFERACSAPSLRRHRPDAPWSLESITRKCLDPDPANRYQQAEQLAEDLRRYLEDRPLKFAPELSWRERVGKWRRRHPRFAMSGLIGVAATILLAAGTVVLPNALSRLDRGDRAVAQQKKQSFQTYAQLTRCYLNATIGDRGLLREGLEVCEEALGHYAILQREDWQKQRVWQLLGQEEQKEVAEEVRELLLLLARARIMTALIEAGQVPPSTSAVAPALVGWSALLPNSLAAGEAAIAEASAPLDRARAIGGPLTARAIWKSPPVAIDKVKEALDFNPSDYWSRFHLGMCYRQQGDYVLAVSEFRACTVLLADFSWGHFNLGEALHQLDKKLEAIEAYTAALKFKPEIAQAYFNRGLVRLDLGNWEEALDDFDLASERGYSDDALHGGRGIALAHLGREDEANAAFEKAWASGWKNLDLRISYAFLISRSRPKEAQDIFLEVLKREPQNARAYYGYGMLLEHQQPDSEDAVTSFSQAIELRPTFVEARLARAVIRARQGRGESFRDDITWCVYVEPTGRTLYGAACFYALLSEKSGGPLAASWAECALGLLGKAFKQGYGHMQAVTDLDLNGIRQHTSFHLLLEGAPKPKDSH
jgi:serine/threonine protein kinase